MKNERASIAVLAFVTVMFILIILATLFYSMVEKSKAQVIEMEKLSNIYDGDMGEVYRERQNVKGIFATLYGDGSLVFSSTNKTLEGKGTYTQYGDISNITITTTAQIPWYANKESITSVDFTNTITPTTTAMWFSGCSNLTTITNMNYLDTSKVTSMTSMFEGCTSLASCDVSSLNTTNVTNMSSMFSGCTALTTLDLSSFNTSKVITMQNLFNNCSNLTTIYASSSWTTTGITTSESLFTNCTKLVGGNGTVYSAEKISLEYAKIDLADVPGYFTSK